MNSVALIFLTTGAIALALTTLTIWARRGFWLRAAGLVLGGAFLLSAYVSLLTILSLPKPVSLEWWGESPAEVISGHLVEGEGIYLWLMFPGTGAPRYYVMPWDKRAAEELREALEQGLESDRAVMMGNPGDFEPTLDDQAPLFYAPPQEAPPAKEEPENAPEVFEQPASAEGPQPPFDLQRCGRRTTLVERLEKEYNERPVHMGLESNGTVLEIFATVDGSTWTAAVTRPDGNSCIIGAGTNWVSAPVGEPV